MNVSDQVAVFKLFHDGIIIECRKDGREVEMHIEMHQPGMLQIKSTFFRLHLTDCERLLFEPLEGEPIKEPYVFSQHTLHLIDAKVEGDDLLIYCKNERDSGYIRINCANIHVYDRSNIELEIDELETVMQTIH